MTRTQKGVLTGMFTGLVLAGLIIGLAAWLNPFRLGAEIDPVQRLAIAIKSLILPALTLAFSIGRLARHRFFTPQDIDGSGLTQATDTARILQSLLQNTLEQVAFASLVYLAWAVTMPAEILSVLPSAALAFFVGRLLFFASYQKGATARSIGFTLSFHPTLLMLATILLYLALQLSNGS